MTVLQGKRNWITDYKYEPFYKSKNGTFVVHSFSPQELQVGQLIVFKGKITNLNEKNPSVLICTKGMGVVKIDDKEHYVTVGSTISVPKSSKVTVYNNRGNKTDLMFTTVVQA